jgi:hypothetical protein
MEAMLTPKPSRTITEYDRVAILPTASMAFRVTVNVPGVAYTWLTGLPELELPSPKLQLKVNGLVP